MEPTLHQFYEAIRQLDIESRDDVPEHGVPLLEITRFLQSIGLFQNVDSTIEAPPASKEAVEKLPKVKVMKNLDETCPICLRELEKGEIQVTMPCKHNFHEECISAWLNKTNSCPVCRFELATDDPAYEEQRENKRRERIREQNVQTLHDMMYS